MGKYRFEVMIGWTRDKEYFKQRNIPIEFYSPYPNMSPGPNMRSDNAANEAALFDIEQIIIENNSVTIVLPAVTALQFSRPNWNIGEIIVGSFEGKRHVRSFGCDSPKKTSSFAVKGKQLMQYECNSINPYMP